MLVKETYTIVCGLNAAVGRPVVNGGLEILHETQKREDVNRRILIWPLPDGHRDDWAKREQMRAGFREEMASVSGFGIFLGGSKGTRKEYELLIAAGGRALPIGASGGVAYRLWCEMRETVPGDLREDFEALGTLRLEDPRLLVALENLLES
jgi:hypothetical protein